jgi:hypothetical protein
MLNIINFISSFFNEIFQKTKEPDEVAEQFWDALWTLLDY